MNNKYNPISS